jgi:protein TonB
VTGVARALAGLGASDALGRTGASTGAPGYGANPKPEYPAQARDQGLQGLVLLRVRVLPDGKSGEVLVERSSGHAILDQAALRAVKAWHFVPATRNGIAVASWASVPVRFSLGS